MTDPRDELIALGRALYGQRWQTATANYLWVNPRTVRYWASGGRPVPPEVLGKLRQWLIGRRTVDVLAAVDVLADALGPAGGLSLLAASSMDTAAVTARLEVELGGHPIAIEVRISQSKKIGTINRWISGGRQR